MKPGWLTPDLALVLGTRGLRGFGLGALSVVIGIYLDRRGFSEAEVGGVLAASLAGGTVGSLVASVAADRWGRRKFLLALGMVSAAAALGFAFTNQFALLVLLALAGNLGASGQEAFVTVEHAIVPQSCPQREWNNAFAAFSLVGSFATALGSLASALPGLVEDRDQPGLWAFRGMFVGYAGLVLTTLALYRWLSPTVEVRPGDAVARTQASLRPTSPLGRMTALFALDGFAGGLVVQSFLSYWLFRKFGLPVEELALVFFIGGSLTGLSFPVAAWLANRIGQIPTMAFTHLPANLFLMLVPMMPSAPAAVALLLARLALSAMDVPARQAYVVAMVRPEERTAAVAVTSVARNLSSVPGPSLAGAMAQAGALSLPVFLGGGLKILYDLTLYAMFRNVKPQAEAEAGVVPSQGEESGAQAFVNPQPTKPRPQA